VAVDPKLVGNYAGIGIASFLAGSVFYALFYKRDRIGEHCGLRIADCGFRDFGLTHNPFLYRGG